MYTGIYEDIWNIIAPNLNSDRVAESKHGTLKIPQS